MTELESLRFSNQSLRREMEKLENQVSEKAEEEKLRRENASMQTRIETLQSALAQFKAVKA